MCINQAFKDLNIFFRVGSPELELLNIIWLKNCSNNLKSNQSCYHFFSQGKKKRRHPSSSPIQVGHCCFSLCEAFLPEVCQVYVAHNVGSGYGQRRSENRATEWGLGCAWEGQRLRFRSPLGRFEFTGYLLFIGIHAFLWSIIIV